MRDEMSAGVDFAAPEAIHYFALALYVLFFLAVLLTCRKRLFPERKNTVRSSAEQGIVAENTHPVDHKANGVRHRNKFVQNDVKLKDPLEEAMGLTFSKQISDLKAWIGDPDPYVKGGIPATYVQRLSPTEIENSEGKAYLVSQEYLDENEYISIEEQSISEHLRCGEEIASANLPLTRIDRVCTHPSTQKAFVDVLADKVASEIVKDSVHRDLIPVSGKQKEVIASASLGGLCAEFNFPVYQRFADQLSVHVVLEALWLAAETTGSLDKKGSLCSVPPRGSLSSTSVNGKGLSNTSYAVAPNCIVQLADDQAVAIVSDALEFVPVLRRKRSSVELYASCLSDTVIQLSIHNQDMPWASTQDQEVVSGSTCDQLLKQVLSKVSTCKEDELNNNLFTECEERTSVDSGICEQRLDSGIDEARYDAFASADLSPTSPSGEVGNRIRSCQISENISREIPVNGYAKSLANFLAEDEDGSADFIDSDEDSEEDELKRLEITFEVQQQTIHVHISGSEDSRTSEAGYVNGTVCEQIRPRNGNKTRLKGDRPLSSFAQDILEDFLDDEHFSDNDLEDDGFHDNSELVLKEGNRNSIQARVEFLESKLELAPTFQTSCEEFKYMIDDTAREPGNSVCSPTRTMAGKGVHHMKTPVVLDLGCGVIKAGMAGQRVPQCYCPSVIGVPRRFSQEATKMTKAYYVGDEAWSLAGMLQISYPVKPNITIWSDVSSFLEHFLEQELRVNNNEHPVLMTELARSPARQREKLTEIMFERFGVPGFYLANQGTLAMNSMGLLSGICLNLGFSCTQAIPVYESHVIDHAVTTLDVGGDTVTEYFGRLLLGNKGLAFSTSSEKLLLNQIKEQLGYISSDPWKEQESYKLTSALHEMYTMPDGQEIPIGTERFVAGEILFDPKRLGLNQQNVAEMVLQSISLLDPDLHDIMSSNVLVTGGGSRLPGFGDRLEQELALLTKGSKPVRVLYADNPSMAAWMGGSVLSSIPSFEPQWMSMECYAEHGAKLVHKVCF